MKRKVKLIISLIVFILIIILISLFAYANFTTPPYIKNVQITDSINFKDQVIFNVEVDNYFYKLNKDTWCYLTIDNKVPSVDDSEWVKASNGYCNFTVPSGDYKIYVKDKYGNINDIDSQKVEINKVLEIKTNKENVYLYKGGSEVIKYELVTLGDINEDVTWSSSNEDIASVVDGKITGNNYGAAEITLKTESGTTNKVNVFVSSFITKPLMPPSLTRILVPFPIIVIGILYFFAKLNIFFN